MFFPPSAGMTLRAGTPSPSESSDGGGGTAEFRRWWQYSIPLLHQRWVAVAPQRTPPLTRVRRWSSYQATYRQQAHIPMPSPMKLYWSLFLFFKRIRKTQAICPDFSAIHELMVFMPCILCLPHVETVPVSPRGHHTQPQQSTVQYLVKGR